MQTRSGRRASQHPAELAAMIDLFNRLQVRSYLEIGARHGDTFFDVMRALPTGSIGVAVDMPGAIWGAQTSQTSLSDAVIELRGMGYEVTAVFADSQAPETVHKVQRLGPFHAALIDGDHRYEGVKTDWMNYGRLAQIVAFHDIAGHGEIDKPTGSAVEVPQLWSELIGCHKTMEFVAPGSRMGIGVIIKEAQIA